MTPKLTLATLALLVSAPAFAADLSAPEAAPEAPAAAAPAVTHPWTFSIEGSPEFFAIDQKPGTQAKEQGALADFYGKLGLSYTFDNHVVVGTSYQLTDKKNRADDGSSKDDTYGDQIEATLGYKYKIDTFTLTPSVGLGYAFGATGIYGDEATPSKDNNAAYYTVSLAGDWKLNKQWTWNVFNARWRDAFGYTWQTPKLSTGITYNVDDTTALYTNVGYAWKKVNSGTDPNFSDLDGDKWNVAVGLKKSF
nr:hypothetical protein [uncultured Gellertiella sp.]